ncbi:MAG: hypothetical protein FWF44_04355 [Defluviitaleaceae bacterium]|nr:hypothetical protein [Defluviitaleaceae bacterium]
MEEKTKVTNPLTIIGIFCGIAEVAGTTVLAFLPQELQSVFIWFVMLFPALILLLFFGTLFFKPTVLYSPSDYRSDDSFVQLMTKLYEHDIDKIHADMVDLKQNLTNAPAESGQERVDRSPEIDPVIGSKIDGILDSLAETKKKINIMR